jgi:hypothetical protein
VWKHGENFFPGFKCKCCLKIWRGVGATRLKEHLAGKTRNVVCCTKCPPDVWSYFSHELQSVRERKKSTNEEILHRVHSMVEIPDNEDEELHEVLELSRCEAEF